MAWRAPVGAALTCLIVAISPAPVRADGMPPDPFAAYSLAPDAAADARTIREQPDPGTAAVGTLNPSSPVIVTGVRAEVDGPAWWQVVVPGGGRGWVPAASVVPTEGTAAVQEAFPLACVGTEPFWSLSVRDGTATFEDMGTETRAEFTAGPWIPVVGRNGFAIVTLKDGEATGFLAAAPNVEGCSDNMSDLLFPLDATVLTPGGAAYAGCCSRSG